jgi:hypothetical protein
MGPSLFFGPIEETHAERIYREAQAKNVCSQCDVAGDCLVEGQAEEGIWGGLTDAERRRQTQRSRYSPPRITPVVMRTEGHEDDSDTEPWTPLESFENVMLFRRDSKKSWHGSEFILVKNGIVVTITTDLTEAYARYHTLLG